MVCSPDGDTYFFDIVDKILKGYIFKPFLFIIFLKYDRKEKAALH